MRDKWAAGSRKTFFLVLLLGVGLLSNARAAWQTIGSVTRVAEKRINAVVLQTSSGARVDISFFGDSEIRVRVAPTGVFERSLPYALLELKRKAPQIRVVDKPQTIELIGPAGARVVVNKNPFAVTIFDAKGEKVLADAAGRAVWFDKQSGEIQAAKLRGAENETYYGFGEKALPFSRDAQVISNWNTDAYGYKMGSDPLYQAIPFFIALRAGEAYGLFFHNTFRTTFDMGKSAPDRYTFGATGGELDYFVFLGGAERTPARVLTDYSELTGRMPLPPLWSLGYQQSRFSYFPESRVREIAGEFRKRKIPADVIYIDIDYMDGYRIFTWDREKFPNPAKMISELAADGFKSIVIVNPAVKKDENYPVYREGREKGFFVRRADGAEFHGSVWAGESAFIDFTNPAARDWYGAKYKTFLDAGVAGFWNDMNEPSVFPAEKDNTVPQMFNSFKTLPLDARHAGDGTPGTHARFHNVYGMQMARATFENLRKLDPERRPFVLSRAGFSGVQRYAAVWTGDNTASWDHLALSLNMLLNMSVSGIPFVGADVGGYSENPSGELFARWLQAAALTPYLRPHAERGTVDKEPWRFGEDFEKINRAAVELRYRFLPYLYTLFREHEETGMPVMRPLWFEYPQDLKTYQIEDQYLVGRDLLVAPVVREGQRKRGVYFPAGDDWRDWQTGELYKGGSFAETDAPLDRLPIFVRVGAVIPTQPVIQHTGETAKVDLTINVIAGIAPDKTETSGIFQDAGDGYGYRRDGWRETKIIHRKGLLTLTRTGNFAGGQKIKFIEALGIPARPREIRIDGKAAEIDFDQKRKRVRVELTGEPKEIALVP